jgi:hypothetical protein
MTKRDEYITLLQTTADFEAYLVEHSNLPGPRANLELADAAASIATREQVAHLLSYAPYTAGEQPAEEFLPVCGTIALGYGLTRGEQTVVPLLHQLANDPRWRVRESVAIALQIYGDTNLDGMVQIVHELARGSVYQQRAAAAAICEPRLLVKAQYAREALAILQEITQSILTRKDRKSDEFKTLCKGLAYCWSVAVAALPTEGKPFFTAWVETTDPDIRWIMRENLKKNRLMRIDSSWVQEMAHKLG